MVVKRESIGTGKKIRIGVIQPDFDPWEKWEGKPGEKFVSHLEQFNTFIRETKILAKEKPDMIIWPETAVPFYILLPRYYKSLSDLFVLVDTLHIPVFTGLPVADYFDSLNAPATAQRAGSSQLYVETYNSTVLVEPGRKLGPIHRKTILVPFAERIPYAESFKFLIEPLKWNVGISGWGKGADTILNGIITGSGDTLKFASLICYESVYPDYTRELVRKGAGMLVIVTNDSWWGNTSGAYQHAAYASLRAVETRRWVVQCANGGISEVVDPAGTVRYKTGLYTQARFIDEVHLRSDQTFYVMHGDLTGKICILISMLLIGVSLAGKKHRAEK
jgi:apolipoprotein N-acyltransferase